MRSLLVSGTGSKVDAPSANANSEDATRLGYIRNGPALLSARVGKDTTRIVTSASHKPPYYILYMPTTAAHSYCIS